MNLSKIFKKFLAAFDGKSSRNELLLKKRLEVLNNINKINFAIILRKVSESILKGNYELVCEILEPVIFGLENSEVYKKQFNSNFYDFANNFEIVLYIKEQKKESNLKIINTKAPYRLIYYFYGAALSNCGKLDEAKKNLKIALRWDPVSSDILAEYAMHCYRERNYEEFYKATLKSFNYAASLEQVALCYKYLGLYYRRVEKYQAAKCCFLLALKYVDDQEIKRLVKLNNASFRELGAETSAILNKSLDVLDDATIEEYGEKFSFPTKPSSLVIATCNEWGERFMTKGNSKLARYFYEKAYKLTKSMYLKTILENLEDN